MEVSRNTEQMLNQMIVGSWVTQAIYVAAEIGIADFLAAGPRTADELARDTGTHAPSLYRVLRALTSIGLFNEEIDGRFSLTPTGELLGSDTPGSKRSLAIMAGSEFYRSWGGLLTSVKTGDGASCSICPPSRSAPKRFLPASACLTAARSQAGISSIPSLRPAMRTCFAM